MATQVEYKSLSGAEIHAVFGNIKFGELQMIKYAISRSVAPVYTMGSPNPRSYASGPRSITGALIFSHLSTGGLVKAMAESGQKVFLSHDEQANYHLGSSTRRLTDVQKQVLRSGGTIGNIGYVGEGGLTAINQGSFDPFTEGNSVFDEANYGSCVSPVLADQLPPFDITLVGIPEGANCSQAGGVKASMQSLVIRGVKIVTQASGTSIQDLVIEQQMSFIAMSIDDWKNPDPRYNKFSK